MADASSAYERHYVLRCSSCDAQFADDGVRLECGAQHAPSLLHTVYRQERFAPDTTKTGMFRYREWLPAARPLDERYGTICYKSRALGERLGLAELWIAFSGYWPERGAHLPTCTFKDLEALAVLARLPERDERAIVIASSGNAAAAFAHACTVHSRRCLIVVPERGVRHMRLLRPLGPTVKVVALAGSYDDALRFAREISARDGFLLEGGIRNVARRDGVGTALLAAVESMGSIPDLYFQAIGSGAGAIAICEAARRLIRAGSRGQVLPRLMVSQNRPFAPVAQAWRARSRHEIEVRPTEYRRLTRGIRADALSNRRPAYAVQGGLFSVLHETRGEALGASNAQVAHAMELFLSLEGADVTHESGVALASLISAVKHGLLDRRDRILLHMTGGGRRRLAAEQPVRTPEIALSLAPNWEAPERDHLAVARLFSGGTG